MLIKDTSCLAHKCTHASVTLVYAHEILSQYDCERLNYKSKLFTMPTSTSTPTTQEQNQIIYAKYDK